MRLFLVTGGAGFIGSHIVRYLIEHNQKVRIIDDFSTGSIENISDVIDKVDIYNVDICNIEAVEEAVAGVDYIFHEAAVVSIEKSLEDIQHTSHVNVDGTLNLLLAARDRGIKRFVLASSASVYGLQPMVPQSEDAILAPASPYALSKCSNEQYAKIFTDRFRLDTVCLRYFNVFGPNQDPFSPYSGVIPKFIAQFDTCQQPKIYGDGNQTRDFIYVDNVVEANILACFSEKAQGQIINVGTGNNVSINILAKKISQRLEVKLNPVYTKPREYEVYHSLADIRKARHILNFIPRVSFLDGLNRTIQWFVDKQETQDGFSKQETVDV